MTDLIDNTPNQPFKCRIKNWVNINDGCCGTYETNGKIKFNAKMLKSSLYDYSDACYLLKKLY